MKSVEGELLRDDRAPCAAAPLAQYPRGPPARAAPTDGRADRAPPRAFVVVPREPSGGGERELHTRRARA